LRPEFAMLTLTVVLQAVLPIGWGFPEVPHKLSKTQWCRGARLAPRQVSRFPKN